MIGRAVSGLATGLALLGGLILLALTIMVCASIAGRALIPLGLRPVPGDVELVEMGVGAAVFAMLPYAHLKAANARVDLLSPLYGRRGNAVLDRLSDAAVLVTGAVLCWSMIRGLRDRLLFVDTTFILGLPIWWGYAAGVVGLVALILVALVRLARPAGPA